jgi:hypothetical protein
MDHTTFDHLARRLGTPLTRRAGLGLALTAALGHVVTDEPGADGKGKRRKKRKKTQKTQGCPDSMIDCGGGVCVADGTCCPGEKPCDGGCIRARECCPHTERSCPGGVCVANDACCPIMEERCGAECCVLGEEAEQGAPRPGGEGMTEGGEAVGIHGEPPGRGSGNEADPGPALHPFAADGNTAR